MHLIKRRTLVDYWTKNPAAKTSLSAWIYSMKAGEWTSMSDVQSSVSSAKVLNAERVRFEISGGSFRLIASFKFKKEGGGTVYVKFIGTHAQYDRINALTVSDF